MQVVVALFTTYCEARCVSALEVVIETRVRPLKARLRRIVPPYNDVKTCMEPHFAALRWEAGGRGRLDLVFDTVVSKRPSQLSFHCAGWKQSYHSTFCIIAAVMLPFL